MFQEANCSNQAIADCQVRMQKKFWKNVRSHFPIFTVILAGRVEKNERTHSGKQRVD